MIVKRKAFILRKTATAATAGSTRCAQLQDASMPAQPIPSRVQAAHELVLHSLRCQLHPTPTQQVGLSFTPPSQHALSRPTLTALAPVCVMIIWHKTRPVSLPDSDNAIALSEYCSPWAFNPRVKAQALIPIHDEDSYTPRTRPWYPTDRRSSRTSPTAAHGQCSSAPSATRCYRSHALPASRALPPSLQISRWRDRSQSRPLVPAQQDILDLGIGVAFPGCSEGGRAMSGVSLKRSKAAILHSRCPPSSAHFRVLPFLSHTKHVDYLPQWFLISTQKPYPSPTDIRRFSRAAVRSTSTTVVTFLFSLEQSGASFRHGHIIFRDSVHEAYLDRNDNGEGINAYNDREARAPHSARPQRPREQRHVCRADVRIRRELPFRHYSSGARELRASARERWGLEAALSNRKAGAAHSKEAWGASDTDYPYTSVATLCYIRHHACRSSLGARRQGALALEAEACNAFAYLRAGTRHTADLGVGSSRGSARASRRPLESCLAMARDAHGLGDSQHSSSSLTHAKPMHHRRTTVPARPTHAAQPPLRKEDDNTAPIVHRVVWRHRIQYPSLRSPSGMAAGASSARSHVLSADSEDQENSTRDSGSDDESVENNFESNADPQENETFNGRNTRVLLPQAEFERLRREGRCFRCKIKGHLSRDCPGTEQEAPVEILAVHLAEDDESEECSEEDGTANDTAQLSGIAESSGALNCSTDEGNLSSSEENSDDQYSDSGEEYFVGVMTIATDHRREGGRSQRRNHERKYRRRKYGPDVAAQVGRLVFDKP
ncbi:hypothetical protein B0H13DRAFT_2555868 [Mycena leptocephala]|nr:hypothetical protein B0H13DRAFT_2555868 [Mycena leptocephala]